jgi:hypothetical protein
VAQLLLLDANADPASLLSSPLGRLGLLSPPGTLARSGETAYPRQARFDCRTCDIRTRQSNGLCFACAADCHAEHDVVFAEYSPGFL